jgi:hypothetical protein
VNKTFEGLPLLIFVAIFPIVIGVLLRLPKLIIEIKDKKEWTFEWVKVIAIGIPALYVGLSPILSHTTFGMHLFFPEMKIYIGHLGNSTLFTTAGIVFGYVLIDSIKK